MTNALKTAKGELTAYAFSCGYIEVAVTGPKIEDNLPFEAYALISKYRVTLKRMPAVTAYRVTVTGHGTGIESDRAWSTLKEARKDYKQMIKAFSE